MTQLSKFLFLSLLALTIFSSCGDDDTVIPTDDFINFDLNINGLENLGSNFLYEGWIIVDGDPVSTGTFAVDADGNLSQSSFGLNKANIDAATAFVLTIEPSPDPDASPSDVHILAGDFDGTNADLTVSHGSALGDDFTTSNGNFILATPTDGGSDTDENSGVWFLDPAAGPGPGLDLPTLPAGWAYEGWVVIDGTPVSTGSFTDLSASDNFNGFSGTADGPPFPGEDFLNNAPAGLSFPLDLSNQTVVISVEPVPDNSLAPFTLKPLVGVVPADALDHTSYDMNNNATETNPTGSVSRAQ